MKHPACPYCQQDQYVIKSGLNHTDSQRYRCQSCRRYFTPAPKPEGYDLSVRTQALKLSLEGTSFRAIGRLLGLHHQTVSNWVTEAASTLPNQITETTPTQTIELDELYPFIQQKKQRLRRDGGGPRQRPDRGPGGEPGRAAWRRCKCWPTPCLLPSAMPVMGWRRMLR